MEIVRKRKNTFDNLSPSSTCHLGPSVCLVAIPRSLLTSPALCRYSLSVCPLSVSLSAGFGNQWVVNVAAPQTFSCAQIQTIPNHTTLHNRLSSCQNNANAHQLDATISWIVDSKFEKRQYTMKQLPVLILEQ